MSPKSPRKLDLVVDDTRLQGITQPERQAALRAMAPPFMLATSCSGGTEIV